MARLWGKLIKKHRIWRDVVSETDGDDAAATQEALSEVCYRLDIPRPIWLDKHTEEIERFGYTSFSQDHFIESINFDKFEIEFLREKHRSADPRNDFGSNV